MGDSIKEVDFKKLPDVGKFEKTKVKTGAWKHLLIIFVSLIAATGIGIGLFYLIQHFA